MRRVPGPHPPDRAPKDARRTKVVVSEAAGATHVGLVRRANEDTFVVDSRRQLYLVSDGMGGHRGGAVAARIVADGLPTILDQRLRGAEDRRAERSAIREALVDVSQSLWKIASSNPALHGMGATLVMALVRNEALWVAHLGDSRAYLLRAGKLTQLTQDHSVVEGMVRAGKITREQAHSHPLSSLITKHVGMPRPAPPDVQRIGLEAGDLVLLCSDGLTTMLPDSRIQAVLRGARDTTTVCRRLVQRANAAGGRDNTTVVALRFEFAGPKAPSRL